MKGKENRIKNFQETISHIQILLSLSLKEILVRFSDYPLCIIKYIEKGTRENVVEMRIDRERSTITCFFDDSEMCNFCYLFPDNINKENILEYICYLNDKHNYDFILKKWLLDNCYTELNIIDKEIAFSFYRNY